MATKLFSYGVFTRMRACAGLHFERLSFKKHIKLSVNENINIINVHVSTNDCQIKHLPKPQRSSAETYLVKSFLHHLAAVPTLYQRALGGRRRGAEAEEALGGAVAQQAQEGIGLLRLHRLEAGEGRDVPGLGAEPHHLLAVLVVDQLLLRDLLHLLSHALSRETRRWGREGHLLFF